MPQPAEIKHLRVGFETAERTITAVDDISFHLIPGETMALLGESGCGKSLTSLSLMRLLPPYGVYGQDSEVQVEGNDLLRLPESVMRQLRGRRLAIIFQEPMTALNPVLKIGEQLAEALRQGSKTFDKKALQKRMISLLNEVEMPEPALRLNQYPHQLSGGQKQRVVIAMALANQPDILIADEPTTALDVTIQAQILQLLKKLQNEHNMSMLLITHDLSVVKAVADRVCVMYAGQLVEQATVDEFFTQIKHPYSQQLFASLPDFNKRGHRLQTIAGSVPGLDAMPSGCRFHPRCAHRFAPCADIEPTLQDVDGRLVRCHLYPEHREPPPLHEVQQTWEKKAVAEDVILRAENLCVDFILGKRLFHKGQVLHAVDNLSLTLRRGKTLALVGESGCGKTTASRALLRLLPITSGEVFYQEQNISALRGKALRDYRKKVQIVFQDPFSSMNPRMTIGEIIAEGMQAQGMAAKTIAQKQHWLLERVNLPQKSLDRYPHQFSGGQRQRICIARALATEPEILICDEPTSALDVSVQAQILNLLKELQQELGMAYLFITHNMAVVSYMADDVMVMRKGRCVEKGSCEAIFKHPEQAYTRQLLASVLEI
ncbi:ABC transporter ATP-binding protein [Legionella erythra]|uniref:ABC-type dipeptide transporter n=1 Tax=Legionella erythra TaxID=448 RepID=A0A0W0TWQ6_LEGER|nr:ABC transporter ATP-binding protein [Legionella erythra]KTC99952.1 ABC dipeptide/oligopeptide/nickel transport, ATPase component [Legionella erythra]